MAVNEAELHLMVHEFDKAARPTRSDPDAPATVAELNNLVTQISCTFDKLIGHIYQK